MKPRIIDAVYFKDERGTLKKPSKTLSSFEVRDIYVSGSKTNVFRGLHYQIDPFQQQKLFTIISGAVDLYVLNPKNYVEYYKFNMHSNEPTSLHVPSGFATGILSLASNSQVMCLASNYYSPKHEIVISYDNISELKNINLNVSDKDKIS